MTKLLSAGFTRLFKNKLLWFGSIFLNGFFVFLVVNNYMSMNKHPDVYSYTSDYLLFAPFQIIGVFASCFTGMFLGTEYSDGTLRNKLIIGRSRTDVYLSNFILSFIASLFASAMAILATGTVGIMLFGAFQITLVQIIKYLGLGVLMLAAFAGIFTLISMLIPSKAAGSVICILAFFLLLIAATYVSARLDADEFLSPGYRISIDGVEQIGELIPNPWYLQGTARAVFEFFQDLLPTSQGSLLMAQRANRPAVMALCSLGITICTTVSGIFHFKKKDLK